jgi:PBSX family phage terminase large subunit
MTKSTPYFSGFIPFGYQRECLDLLYHHDYSKYTPEILLSGSVGSAKSILLAHWAISHCLRWKGARVAISRQSLPDLRRTVYQEIIEHLSDKFIEGVHYKSRSNTCEIKFPNGSEIIGVSFGDKRYSKVRSLKLSGIIMEEGTDFDDAFFEQGAGFSQFKARLRRIHNVPENFLIIATNPGDPSSMLHSYFIENESEYESRYVFYSITTDNPYLDPIYIKQLRQDYSVLEADRYLRGKWISLAGKGIYHSYNPKDNFIKKPYIVKEDIPINLCFDFNSASNKPQSACIFQFDGEKYHCFAESIIHDSLWCLDNLEDLETKGYLRKDQMIYIHGDATGRAKTSNAQYSNYEIIKEWLTHRGYTFKVQVPKANPPVTTRHVKMNAICKNDLGDIRLLVYSTCKTLDQGMRLTKFKPETRIEDDSKPYQHVTTALGYGIFANEKIRNKKRSTSYTRKGS